MKVENTTFNQYALELYRDNVITGDDLLRAQRSLASKGTGFIADMDELAQCLRSGLSTGTFALTQRLNCVFARPSRGSRLPEFLGVPLAKIFSIDGALLQDHSPHVAATLLQFLSCLKRTDPPRHQVKELESKVWSTLEQNFNDEVRVLSNISTRLQSDPEFETLWKLVRHHFRRLVDLPLEVHFAYGPGKNLDRYDSISGMDWYVVEPYPWHDVPPPKIRSWVDSVAKSFNHSPFEGAPVGRHPLKLGDAIMKCSAQPKTYKAFRGVGVTSAFRMALQLSLQRTFYAKGLTTNMPLNNQEEMRRNLSDNWEKIGTIDLSSASDRCYWSILHALGSGVEFFDVCYRYRTKVLSLPTGNIRCASPVMGEAITFPLMSAYFTSICLAVADYYGSSRENIRVYGDDLQVEDYDQTIALLEALGSKPSHEKSYPPFSYFKESCEAHYVSTDSGHLRNSRPAFIPSGKFNRRGRLDAADAFKLLILSKDAYMRSPELSRACCTVIEEATNLRLPDVPFNGPFLGRPTFRRASFGHYQPVLADDSPAYISSRGYYRAALRSVENGPDAKLHQKQVYRLMSKKIVSLRYKDDLRTLEDEIRLSAWKRYFPEHFMSLDMRPESTRHFALGLAYEMVTDDMMSTEIARVIQQIRV